MANYGVAPPIGLFVGQTINIFNAETPTAPQASQAIALARGSFPNYSPVVFGINFASSPTDSLEILGSQTKPAAMFSLAAWTVLYTSTNKQQDYYSDQGSFPFYCAYLASQSGGGAVTVQVSR